MPDGTPRHERFVFPDGTALEIMVFTSRIGDAGTSAPASWTAPASGTPPGDDGVGALGRDLALPEADGARLTAAPSVCSRCAGEFLYPEDWERNREGGWNLLMRCPSCEARTRIVLGREAVEDLNRTLYRHAQALAREAEAQSRRNFEEEAQKLVRALARDLILPMDF